MTLDLFLNLAEHQFLLWGRGSCACLVGPSEVTDAVVDGHCRLGVVGWSPWMRHMQILWWSVLCPENTSIFTVSEQVGS